MKHKAIKGLEVRCHWVSCSWRAMVLWSCLAASLRAGQPAPDVAWQYDLPGYSLFSPAADTAGNVYFSAARTNSMAPATNGWLGALSSTGTLKWSQPFTNALTTPPTIAEDGTVYVGCADFNLYAFGSDGKKKWTFSASNAPFAGPMLGSDGTIYCATPSLFQPGIGTVSQAYLYALDHGGQAKWQYPLGINVNFPPGLCANQAGTLYFPEGGALLALCPTGIPVWTLLLNMVPIGGPALACDGTIIYTAASAARPPADGWLRAFWMNGSPRWELAGTNFTSPPVAGPDNTIYIGTASNGFQSVSLTGSYLWSFPTPAPVSSAAAIDAGGTVYFGDEAGNFYALNPDGSQRWKLAAGSAIRGAPVIAASSNLYFGTDAGALLSLNLGTGPATNGWPMFQADSQHRGQSSMPVPVPGTPSVVADGGDKYGGLIHLEWTNVLWAESYEIWRSSSDDLSAAVLIATNLTRSLACNDSNANYRTPYTYWVRALNMTGASSFSAPVRASQTVKLWSFAGKSDLTAPVADRQGNLYLGTTDYTRDFSGTNSALSLTADGQIRWQYGFPGPTAKSPAVGPDGTVFFLNWNPFNGTNTLYAFKPTGELKWSVPFKVNAAGSPVVGSDGTIYFNDESFLNAISPDGKKLGKYPSGSDGNLYPPAIGPNGMIYCGTSSGLAAKFPTGDLKWTASTIRCYAPSVGADGTIYTVNIAGWFMAVRPDGTTLWSQQLAKHKSPPVVTANGISIWHGYSVMAFDAAGNRLWEYANGGVPMDAITGPNPMVLSADGRVYFYAAADYGGRASMVALNLDGTLAQEYPLAAVMYDSPILLDGGILVLALNHKELRALKVPAGPATGAWAMARHDPQGSGCVGWTPTSPSPPDRLSVAPFIGKARLAWRNAGLLATTNEVWRSVSPDLTSAVQISTVSATNGFVYDTNVAAGQTYYYWLRSRNQIGTGAFSQPLTVSIPDGPMPLWIYNNPGPLGNPALGFDGTIYVCNGQADVIAIAPTGVKLWETNLNIQSLTTPVVGPSGNIYVATASGLRVLSPDGQVLPTIDPTSWFLNSLPAIAGDGTIYLCSVIAGNPAGNQASLNAYRPDGTNLWRKGFAKNTLQTPFISQDGTILIDSYYASDIALNAINPDGTDKWRSPLAARITTALAMDGSGRIIFAGTDNILRALKPGGQPDWERTSDGPFPAHFALGVDGSLFDIEMQTDPLEANSNRRLCLRWCRILPDGTTGRVVDIGNDRGTLGFALAANGNIYLNCGTNFAAFDKNGNALWQYDPQVKTLPSPPLLGLDGSLYWVAGNNLYAFKTASGLADGPFPMARANPRQTASVNRPVPPPLLARWQNGQVQLSIATPASAAFTLLQSGDFSQWQIATNATLSQTNWIWVCPPQEADQQWFRTAIP